MQRFVSGQVLSRAMDACERQIASVPVRPGASQQVPNLRAQLTVRMPSQHHDAQTEEDLRNLTVRRPGLGGIERLQGAQVQQRRTGDGARGCSEWRMARQGLCLHMEVGDPATQLRTERNGTCIHSPIGEVIGQRHLQAPRGNISRHHQPTGAKREALAARHSPEIETGPHRPMRC